jgi:hypothetical protein
VIVLIDHEPDLDFPADKYDPEAEAMLRGVREVLAILGEDSMEGFEQVENGYCEQCERENVARWRYGQFVICRRCVRSRQRARRKAEE